MTRPKVFIASSSEGEEIAKKVQSLLQTKLNQQATVELWTSAFELSATYIESLETVADEADFAVLLLTPDDVTTSRKKKKSAPRDNVIFELGLFMGRLGRKRCFMIQENKADLKLPTDLLGVKSSTYTHPSDLKWNTALNDICSTITKRIIGSGSRLTLPSDAVYKHIRDFCKSLGDTWWWEHMTIDDRSVMTDDGSVISFFRIAHDLLANSVSLSGDTYNKAGHITGHWNSTMTRVYPNENKILYLWKGRNGEASIAYVPLHGLGEIEFVRSSATTQGMTHGHGMFWKVNEAHPAKTFANGIQLRPVTKKGVISTMTSGKANDIRTLVMQTLAEW